MFSLFDFIFPVTLIIKVVLILILGIIIIAAMKYLPKGKIAAFIIGIILIGLVWVYET